MKIYNTMTHSKEEFVPLNAGSVGMYVCGVTVYDECHLGHARVYVAFDVIKRYLEHKGLKVKYVRNVTDIDDKIIDKARASGKADLICATREITTKYFDSFKLYMKRLNVSEPDVEPRATEHIPEIIKIIEGLLEKGFAYILDGDVYFEVSKFKVYGRLSKRSLDEMAAGARVDVNEKKRSPMDFALWKKAKDNEPSWGSPWGKGRPGWHIECSAMSSKYLGQTFDIHGGGQDLIFPHHENEIAQSEAFSGKKFVKYWVHNGFVTVNQEKMSKSLGNFFALKDIFEKYPGNAVRLFLLSKHYRSPIDFCNEELLEAKKNIERIENCLGRIKENIDENLIPVEESAPKSGALREFEDGMDDDFNTARGLAAVFQLVSDINVSMGKEKNVKYLQDGFRDLKTMLDILGIECSAFQIRKIKFTEMMPAASLSGYCCKDNITNSDIEDLIRMRNFARNNKDWKTADVIRGFLSKMSVTIRDEKDGTSYIVS